jgi:hypothetical protein
MRKRVAICFLVLPWTSVFAGLMTGGSFAGAVAGGLIAALVSGAIGRRSGYGFGSASLFALATAALSVAAVIGTFLVWIAIECRDTGLDRC